MMNDVFSLLAKVRQRPSMYVGQDSEHRQQQLQGLELMLHGYSVALESHDIEEPGRSFIREFSDYLRATRGWGMSLGPAGAVIEHAQSQEDAWRTFWDLVDEFRQTRYPQGWCAC